MFTTILVPLDGSALAKRSLPYASALAHTSGGQLILVRATSNTASPQRPQAELNEVASELRSTGLQVDAEVCQIFYDGVPESIAECARERGADLIVMSTHGRGGLGRWVYGSVADSLLRESPAPVLLVSSTCERPWSGNRVVRILVPLDGSKLAEEALGPAREMATLFGAEILLLQVVEPLSATLYAEAAAYLRADPEAELAEARQYVDDVAAQLRADGLAVTARATVGGAAATIATTARDQSADLITLASHGRGGLARLVMGSIAAGVIQRATVPLLVVRPAAIRRAETMRAPTPAAVTSDSGVTLTLSQREVDLIRRGLGELLYMPERDPYLADPVRALLARLKEASEEAATARMPALAGR